LLDKIDLTAVKVTYEIYACAQVREKEKLAKETGEGADGAVAAIKVASENTKKHKKKEKETKYSQLPDDISLPNKFGGETFSAAGGKGVGGGSAGNGPGFPTWACTEDRIQKSSKIIRPTNTELLDVDGKPIHAHGGGFLAPGQGGGNHKRWWWYGETNKANPKTAGINAYSSSDLQHWKLEGLMINQKTLVEKLKQLKTSSAFDVIRNNASAVVIVERPKVMLNTHIFLK
jgi:hypothetical protein